MPESDLFRCANLTCFQSSPSLQTTKGRGRGRATKLGNRTTSNASLASYEDTENEEVRLTYDDDELYSRQSRLFDPRPPSSPPGRGPTP